MMLSYSIADLDSGRHDLEGQTPAAKVIICSSPRTGSYLLCEAMRRAGIGVPHEYFNPPTIRVLTRRWNLRMPERQKWWRGARNRRVLGEYLAALTAGRTRNGVFAVKLQYWQYSRLLDNAMGEDFLAGSRFIHLDREDLLGQAISLRMAQASGRWGVDDIATTPRRRRNLMDLGALDRAIETIRSEEAGWRRFFADRAIVPLRLSYETMREDPGAFALKLAGDLVPAGAAGLPPADAPPKRDDAGAVRAEMRGSYLAVRPLPER